MIITPSYVIGVSGYYGSGKTTLVEKSVPELKRRWQNGKVLLTYAVIIPDLTGLPT